MTYDQWFRSQQGTAYEGAYLFAEAAWDHQQKRIDELETQLAKNNPLLDEAADAIDALNQQRADLLAALEYAATRLDDLVDTRLIGEAIASVKGGAA